MIKGLDRPMFSGRNTFEQAASKDSGLQNFYGAFGNKNMPMNGIMRFANGGDADKRDLGEGTSVAEQYRSVERIPERFRTGAGEGPFRQNSVLDYITRGGGSGLAGDVSEGLAALISTPEGAARGATELAGVEYESQTPYSRYLSLTDALLGIENRAPDDTLFAEDVSWIDEEGNAIPASQAQEIFDILNKNPEIAATAADTDKKIDEKQNPASTVRTGMGEESEGSEADNAYMTNLVMDSLPAELREQVSPEEVDFNKAPHNALALLLMGAKMMQTKGSFGEALGAGLESGTSYLANVAEKEAERKADVEQARIRAEFGGTDAAVIQEAREAKRVYGASFPNATDADFFNFAVRSTKADPSLVEQTLVDNMLKEGSEQSASVASNYAKMFVNSQTASGLGEDNPKVAIGPNGQTLTIREMEARANEFLKQPAAKKAGVTSIPKAINAMGYTPIPLDQISKMSNIPAEGE